MEDQLLRPRGIGFIGKTSCSENTKYQSWYARTTGLREWLGENAGRVSGRQGKCLNLDLRH
jgi:hypothetical protein